MSELVRQVISTECPAPKKKLLCDIPIEAMSPLLLKRKVIDHLATQHHDLTIADVRALAERAMLSVRT